MCGGDGREGGGRGRGGGGLGEGRKCLSSACGDFVDCRLTLSTLVDSGSCLIIYTSARKEKMVPRVLFLMRRRVRAELDILPTYVSSLTFITGPAFPARVIIATIPSNSALRLDVAFSTAASRDGDWKWETCRTAWNSIEYLLFCFFVSLLFSMQAAVPVHGPFQLRSGRSPPFERDDECRPQEQQRHAAALQTQEDLPPG